MGSAKGAHNTVIMPQTTIYLAWARAVDDALHSDTSQSNLFASAAREPTTLLQHDLQTLWGMPGNALMQRLNTPMSWGHPRLVKAIAEQYGIPDVAHILITSGASMAFVLAVQALARPGDHAIVESPTYQPFLQTLQAREVSVTPLPRPLPGCTPDTTRLGKLFRSNTRLVVLSNLYNPGGTLLDGKILRTIAALARAHNAYVIVDEVYRDFAPDTTESPRTAALFDEAIISINSLSKVYGLGRLRVGWLVAAPDVMAALRHAHVTFDNSITPISQGMASVVLEGLPRYRQQALELVATNRQIMAQWTTSMQANSLLTGDLPKYGCVYFPHVNGQRDTTSLVEILAGQHQVVVVPGRFFAAPAHIRISFGGDTAHLQTGLERLAKGLAAAT